MSPASTLPTGESQAASVLEPPGERRSWDCFMGWDPNLPSDLVERIWWDPLAVLAEGHKLQDKPRCTVVRLDEPEGQYTWKRHNWGSRYRALKKSLSRSTAKKTWDDGLFLHDAGLPVPRPRAYLERRLGPFQVSSFFLADYVPGTSLYRFMRFESPAPDVVDDLAQQVAAIWQRLDELCVWHNDFKAENLLVDPAGKVWLIDLERTRRLRRRSELRRRQVRDARDLLHPRNWRANPAAAEVFRQAILQTPAAQETLAGPNTAAHPLRREVLASNRPSQLVTVMIPSLNAAESISACLESVRDMADEILIADAGSTDDTLLLACRFGECRIVQQVSNDPAAFEAWAARQAQHPWILRVLPDEQVHAELGRQVQDRLATEPAESGFVIRRGVSLRGRRLEYSDFEQAPSIRLYRQDAGRYRMHRGRVEVSLAEGRVGQITARLAYEACPRLDDYLIRQMRTAAAVSAGADRQADRMPVSKAMWRVSTRFLRSYVWKRGWMDGQAGFHAACLDALEAYLGEAFLWQSHHVPAENRPLARDQWQDLRVFQPAEEEIPAESADSVPTAVPVEPTRIGPAAGRQDRWAG